MINFQELYETHARDVYRFTLWLTNDAIEAEDITSETFIRAWVHHSRIRTETLKAYLFTIARNIHLQQRRKGRRHVALEDVHADPAGGPDRRTESQHELDRIQRILRDLPEIDRTAFILCVHLGLPYDETARILNLSASAARVRVYRVRRKLIAACLDNDRKENGKWK